MWRPTPDLVTACRARAPSLHGRRMPLDIDRTIVTLALRTDGQVTRATLNAAGVSDRAIRRRVDRGLLVRRHAGVYSLPGPHSRRQRRRAAMLACGRGTALRALSAAAQRRLTDRPEPKVALLHPSGGRGRPELDVATFAVPRWEIEVVDGLRCVTFPHILRELSLTEDRRTLERLCDEAVFRRCYDHDKVEAMVAGLKGRPGAPTLRRLLDEHPLGTTRTINDFEERLFLIVDAQGWPRPLVNQPLPTRPGIILHPDFRWPGLLVVETDGSQHGTRAAEADDAWRDARYRELGYRVERFTWWHVRHEPERVVARLAPYFASGSPPAGGR